MVVDAEPDVMVAPSVAPVSVIVDVAGLVTVGRYAILTVTVVVANPL